MPVYLGRNLPAISFALLCLAGVRSAAGQALPSGALVGRMVDERGIGVADAALTVSQGTQVVHIGLTDVRGNFRIADLRPGRYALLAEQVGFQPVRFSGLRVVAGAETRVVVDVVRRPPPIVSRDERRAMNADGADPGRVLLGDELARLADADRATSLALAFPLAVADPEAAGASRLSVNGTAPGYSRLAVDGIDEILLRHPAFPTEQGTAPAFSRQGLSQARLESYSVDGATPGAIGGLLSLVTRSGANRTSFAPYVSWSGASLGAAAEDNPADSSASSFRGGFAAAGPIRGDTAGWAVHLDYRQEATPGAAPFSRDGIAEAIEAASGDAGVLAWTRPAVRRWTGGSGLARATVPVGAAGTITGRVAYASWNEENPLVSSSLANGAGAKLEASDLSAAILAEFAADDWRLVTRASYQDVSRTWPMRIGQPYITFAKEGAAIGIPTALPGDFGERFASIGQVVVSQSGAHELSGGVQVGHRRTSYAWLPYGFGEFAFGSTDDFAARSGSWVMATSSSSVPELGVLEWGVFLQDRWQASPSLQLLFGFRYEGQRLPTGVISANPEVTAAFGITTDQLPTGRSSGVAPRIGLTWNPDGRSRTVFHAAGGLVPGRHDLVALTEAARQDGSVSVVRATGNVADPADPVEGVAVTFYEPRARMPRGIHAEAGVSHAMAPGWRVAVTGGFQHTDYLLRRDDLNRPPAALATLEDGRPVFGLLAQYGGLVVPEAGTNRRIDGFDHVWGLTSTGYAEQQFATVSLERWVERGLRLTASYTWSRTEDNLPGQLRADVADRALPLVPEGTDWSDGRSDLDVPHRAVIRAEFAGGDAGAFTASAQWRWQSGLPFTPGHAPGVDVNGDGSGWNDPVALDAAGGVTSLLQGAGCSTSGGSFAERNSCRGPAVHGLDAGVGYRLPLGGTSRVLLSVEAFNLVASTTGVVDRAAVLVDPDGAITSNAEGQLVLPLVRNDHFGELLVRRTAPPTIRFGLRVEH